VTVHVNDPIADPEEAMDEYGLALTPWEYLPRANAIVAAVGHQEYLARPPGDFVAKLAPDGLFVDVKCRHDQAALTARGVTVWRL
jgi:UDP-N-acetyl-D-galactosamine dehydrogenase